MKLSEFLKKYRSGVNVATGAAFSVRMLADILHVAQHNLAKWEQKGAFPISESDRLRVKSFFGIDDFENIENEVLKSAIKRYPKGLALVEDLKHPKAQRIPLTGGKTPPLEYGGADNQTVVPSHSDPPQDSDSLPQNDENHKHGVKKSLDSPPTLNEQDMHARTFQMLEKSLNREDELLASHARLTNAHEALSLAHAETIRLLARLQDEESRRRETANN